MISTYVVACIGAAGTITAALVYRKVEQIHVLVNSRLDSVLAQVDDLKEQRDIARGKQEERDERLEP
jgi:hypothetical protein